MRSGGSNPAAVVFKKGGGEYRVSAYWSPRDGSYMIEDLKETFPKPAFEVWEQVEQSAESHNAFMEKLKNQIGKQLAEKP